MRRIGITQRLVREEKYDEIRNALDIRWQELLLTIDLIPIPLPINVDLRLYNGLEINGLILTGGNDLFSQTQKELSILRDKHEIQCIEYAINKSIPIFGVCRGMQLIAEYFGSTFKRVKNHISSRHKIKIVGQNKFNATLNKIINVNSYHSIAIDTPGDDLRVVAICPDDNVIEAIQHKSHLIFGQMWHPERENPFNKFNCQLISNFFDA